MFEAFGTAKGALDVRVKCTNAELGGKHQSFKEMLGHMEHSVFCLALPGDSPSTRRLSEIFLAGAAWAQGLSAPAAATMHRAVPRARPAWPAMAVAAEEWRRHGCLSHLAHLLCVPRPHRRMSCGRAPAAHAQPHPRCARAGCVPVFIGPPWNALPLGHVVDYGDVALFFNITGPTPWVAPSDRWKLEVPEQPPAWQQQTPLTFIQARARPTGAAEPGSFPGLVPALDHPSQGQAAADAPDLRPQACWALFLVYLCRSGAASHCLWSTQCRPWPAEDEPSVLKHCASGAGGAPAGASLDWAQGCKAARPGLHAS